MTSTIDIHSHEKCQVQFLRYPDTDLLLVQLMLRLETGIVKLQYWYNDRQGVAVLEKIVNIGVQPSEWLEFLLAEHANLNNHLRFVLKDFRQNDLIKFPFALACCLQGYHSSQD